MRTIIIGLISLSLVGCLSSAMQSWMGHDAQELVMKWGAPDLVAANDNGKVMTWKRDAFCRQSFSVGNDNKIKAWSFSGC